MRQVNIIEGLRIFEASENNWTGFFIVPVDAIKANPQTLLMAARWCADNERAYYKRWLFTWLCGGRFNPQALTETDLALIASHFARMDTHTANLAAQELKRLSEQRGEHGTKTCKAHR